MTGTSRKSINASVIAVSLFLLLWAAVSALGLVNVIILPSPLSVLEAVPKMLSVDALYRDIGITLARVAAAIGIACVLGVTLGLYFGYRTTVYAYVEGLLHALRSVPATALFPLFLIIIGVGEASIVTLAAYPSLLVILVNTVAGASLANKRRLHQAKILGLGTREMITEILLYEALPSIFDGIRTAVSYSLVLVLAVEMFIGVGEFGLGRRIYEYQATYRIPEAYASILLAGAIGISLNGALTLIERRMLHWLPNVREDNGTN